MIKRRRGVRYSVGYPGVANWPRSVPSMRVGSADQQSAPATRQRPGAGTGAKDSDAVLRLVPGLLFKSDPSAP